MKSSSIFTYISVILVLCLLGIYGIITLHAANIADIMKENINVIVELENESKEIESIKTFLKNSKKIKTESIRFVPKSEALELMDLELGEDFLLKDTDNPFSDILLFNVHFQYIENDVLNKLCESIKDLPGVSNATFYDNMYDYLETNVKRLSRILLIIGLIMGIFAFALIYSTIQLSLYAERFKIRTMELVGASWNQIRKPFVLKSLKLAFWSAFISISILLIILAMILYQFEHFWSMLNLFYILVIFMLMILFAIFITQLASYFVVNRYLGAEKSRFYG